MCHSPRHSYGEPTDNDIRPSLPAGEPAFRPRRYHTKSRNGCFNCKKRRIKCDEAAPACSHCWEKGLQCEYPPTRSSPQPLLSSLPSPTRQVSRSRQPSEGLALSDPRLTAILNEDDVPCPSVMQQGYHRSDVLDLLHHFVVPTDHLWIGSQYAQGLIQDHVRRNAANAPYLLYSALAFSAAHRQYLEPTSNKYRVAGPYHYQHSLRRYFDKLSVVLDGEDAESLFVSCQLHALLAFLNAASAHTGQPGIDLGWVRSMRGIRFITQSPQLIASLQRGHFSSMVRSAAHDWEEICAEQEQFDNDPRVAVDLQHLQILQGLCASSHREHRESILHSIGMLRDLAQLIPEPAVIGIFMILDQ